MEREPITVFAATIEHRHGSDVYMARTEAELDVKLAAFCAQWWHEALEETDGLPVDPNSYADGDEAALIQDYFDAMQERGEWVTRHGPETI